MTAGDIALIAASAIGLLGLIAAIWMFKDIPAETHSKNHEPAE